MLRTQGHTIQGKSCNNALSLSLSLVLGSDSYSLKRTYKILVDFFVKRNPKKKTAL